MHSTPVNEKERKKERMGTGEGISFYIIYVKQQYHITVVTKSFVGVSFIDAILRYKFPISKLFIFIFSND